MDLRKTFDKKRISKAGYGVFRTVFLVCVSFSILYPFMYIIVTAFRHQTDIANPYIIWITRTWTLDNFKTAINLMRLLEVLPYTFLIALVSACLQTLVTNAVGYGFARFQFRGREPLFALVIFTIIVPVTTYIMPLFMMFRRFQIPVVSHLLGVLNPELSSLNLIDTPFPFWIQALFGLGLRSGLFIFIYRQHYRSLPAEIEEAALIDGCGALKTYGKVMFPNAVTSTVMASIISVIWYWNDYYMPAMLSNSRYTVSTALASLRTSIHTFIQQQGGSLFETQVSVQAGALLLVAPVLLIFILLQRFITDGVERSGIVG